MPTIDPNNLGARVSARDFNWGDLVRRAWGPEFSMPDKGAYEFSNGRKWESTDRGLTGLYGVEVAPPFEFDEWNTPTVPDMDTTLMVSDQTSTELLYIDADTSVNTALATSESGDSLLISDPEFLEYLYASTGA